MGGWLRVPAPLAGPKPLGDLAASAEALVAGGDVDVGGAEASERFAAAFAALVELAPPPGAVPSLQPPPAWLAWSHRERGTWPRPASTLADLNACRGPAWLDDAAARARRRLLALRARPVIGHGDFEAQNIRPSRAGGRCSSSSQASSPSAWSGQSRETLAGSTLRQQVRRPPRERKRCERRVRRACPREHRGAGDVDAVDAANPAVEVDVAAAER